MRPSPEAPPSLPTVRSRLIWLVIACLLSGLVASLGLLAYAYRHERRQMESNTIQTARALAQAIDLDLAGAQATLRVLATSPYLAGGDLVQFHRQARDVMDREFGVNIVLLAPSGQQLLNTLRPMGSSLPRQGPDNPVMGIFRSGEGLVSDIFEGPVLGQPLVAVAVPVRQKGQVAYGLAMGILPERLNRILRAQNLPPEWIGGILDSRGRIVARTRFPEKFIGRPAPANLVEDIARNREGGVEALSLDGVRNFAAYSRTATAGWTVVIGIPTAALRSELYYRFSLLVLAVAALLALGLLLAWAMGGSISRSIRSLAAAALDLGAGRPVQPPRAWLREAAEVSEAIATAGRLLQERGTALQAAHLSLQQANDALQEANASLREANASLQESETRFRLMADAAPVFIWMADAGGRHTWFNEGWLAFTGRSLAEEQEEGWQEGLHGDDRENYRLAFARAQAERRPFTQEYRLRRHDGQYRWLLDQGEPRFEADGSFAGHIGSAVDISDRKAAEEERAALATIVEHSDDAIIGKTPAGIITSWNRGAERIFGYRADEEVGRHIAFLFPPERLAEEEYILAAVRRGETVDHYESQRLTRDGRLIDVEVTVSAIRDRQGQPIALAKIARDVSERVRAAGEIQRLNAELEERVRQRTGELALANEALLHSNMELRHFAHAAAHDLQTPLRSIAGFARLLEKETGHCLDAPAREWLAKVIDNARRLHVLIRDLLAYSRLDSQARPRTATHLGQVVAEVVDLLQEAIRAAGAELEQGELPTLAVDRSQMALLFQNLLENGIKYNEAKPPRVAVSARRQGEEWLFAVADNGIGIDPRHHQRIFEIFQRLHGYGRFPGTGIGLAICRRVVERHGGRLWVESREGGGSVFYFTLPAAPAELDDEGESHGHEQGFR